MLQLFEPLMEARETIFSFRHGPKLLLLLKPLRLGACRAHQQISRRISISFLSKVMWEKRWSSLIVFKAGGQNGNDHIRPKNPREIIALTSSWLLFLLNLHATNWPLFEKWMRIAFASVLTDFTKNPLFFINANKTDRKSKSIFSWIICHLSKINLFCCQMMWQSTDNFSKQVLNKVSCEFWT